MNAALARLIQLVPPPPPQERSKDWEAVARRLGTDLPADYKELIGTYGGGCFDNYLWLLEPDSVNKDNDLVLLTEERDEAFEMLWEMGEEKPAELTEEGSRLIPWATTDNGEFLYWLVRPGQEPDGWTVMVNEGRGEAWEHFRMRCTEFLAASLAGEVQSEVLWSEYPAQVHSFRPARKSR